MFSNFYEEGKKFIKEYYKSIIFLVLFYLFLMFPLNFYITTGGGIMEVGDRIVVKDSKYKEKGSFNLAYVSEIKATPATYLLSYVMKDWERVEVNKYTYSEEEDIKDVEFRGKIDLLNSNNNAVKNAFQMASKSYKVLSTSLYIYYVDPKSPNDFKVGDQIIAVNGREISNIDEYKTAVANYQSGDTLDVTVKREEKEKIISATLYEEKEKVIMGIYISAINKYKTYPKVEFNFKSRESGPSGGLIEALSIYNKLVKEDITKGKRIVGTGEIDSEGNILEIGGVKYKLLGAEKQKADIFFAPKGENYKTCIQLKKEKNLKIKVVEVGTLKDAIEYLENMK